MHPEVAFNCHYQDFRSNCGPTRVPPEKRQKSRPHIASDVSHILQIYLADAIQITPNSIEVQAYLRHEIEQDQEMNPDDINKELKEEILDGIIVDRIQNSSSSGDLGMRVLMWLHLAKRPLKVHLQTSLQLLGVHATAYFGLSIYMSMLGKD
ncbi:hypothetical protein BGX38DRAFT_1145535 [Terfezia claveryi]|nr:hypothetical protein BGX38DRAFT_1145535 [Terfezia claveryi]